MSFVSYGVLAFLYTLSAQTGLPAGASPHASDAGAAVASSSVGVQLSTPPVLMPLDSAVPDAGLAEAGTRVVPAPLSPPVPAPPAIEIKSSGAAESSPPAGPTPLPPAVIPPAAAPPAHEPATRASPTPTSASPEASLSAPVPPEAVGPPSPPRAIVGPQPPEASPQLPRGLLSSVLSALLLLLVAQSFGLLRSGLLDHGVIPRALGATQVLIRLGAVLLVLSALWWRLPPEFAAAFPWILVALAAALGWSTRDVLPDFVAGLVLQIEQRVRQGQWLATSTFRGQVVELGFRATRIREASGRLLTLPNRRLITEPLEVETGPGPSVAVIVEVPGELSIARIHRSLREATLLVPWLAPEARIEIQRGEHAGTWIVHAQVIEGRYEEAFAGALREQLDELWGASEIGAKLSIPPPIPSKKAGPSTET